jgi:hypothetical protein
MTNKAKGSSMRRGDSSLPCDKPTDKQTRKDIQRVLDASSVAALSGAVLSRLVDNVGKDFAGKTILATNPAILIAGGMAVAGAWAFNNNTKIKDLKKAVTKNNLTKDNP